MNTSRNKPVGSLRSATSTPGRVIRVVRPLNGFRKQQRVDPLFRITRNIWQGRFASRQRLDELRRNAITHIINVGESPNQLTEADGPFQRIVWNPIEDLVRIPTADAIGCVNAVHECVCDMASNVFIHCVAGWNRSPTVLWLYLIACGIDSTVAKNMIASVSYDAVPAHTKLIDDILVHEIAAYGATRFIPHPRPEALTAPNVGEQYGEREPPMTRDLKS